MTNGNWLRDLHQAARALRRTPAATAVSVVSLALGIAACSTVFSWVRAILLDPLPGVRQPERIVTLETVGRSGELIDSSYPDFRDLRDRTRSLAGVIAFKERPLELGPRGASERVWGLLVSGNYFDVLGVVPALGRFFAGEERSDQPGRAPVAVISSRLWKSRFQSDRGVIGRTVQLDGQSFTVVGVAPSAFPGTIVGLAFDLFVPLTMQGSLGGSADALTARGTRPLYLFARLGEGVALGAARAEVGAVARQLGVAFPATNQGLGATLLPLAQATRGAQSELGRVLRVLMAVAGIVLLIVCANVGNIQLVRALARRRDLAVCLVLGASRRRLLRGLAAESVVVALAGGALGLLATPWLADLLPLLLAGADLPLGFSGHLDLGVAAFTLLAALLAAGLTSLVPVLRGAARDPYAELRNGSRATAAHAVHRIGGLLVVPQLALALVTVTGAGLLMQSLAHARNRDLGFEAKGVLVLGLELPSRGESAEQGLAALAQIGRETVRLPEVEAAALAADVPLGPDGGSWEDLAIAGYLPQPGESLKIYRNLVSPGYFELLHIAREEGRLFADRDDARAPTVAIVNRTFARRFFAGGPAIGRQLTGWGRPLTVVGVVADSRYHDLREPPQPYFYVPLRQFYRPGMEVALHLRSPADLGALGAAARRQIAAVAPEVRVSWAQPLAEYVAFSYAPQRVAAALLSALAALAVFLAALGLYGVLAYGVAQRRREIAIRTAVGARPLDVARLVVRRGLLIAAAGVALGLLVALAAARLLGALLVDVGPGDPLTLGGAATLLAAVALAASLVPARRAARVDPMEVLRSG